MMRSHVSQAEDEAAALGHDIRWDTIGEDIAHGHCARCSAHLGVARSREGIAEHHGQAVERACPRTVLQTETEPESLRRRS